MGTNKNRTKIQKVKGWAHISEVLAEYKFMSKPTRKQLEEQAKAAFQEYLMSSHLVGLRIAYKLSDQMWEDFYRFLEWRWDRLYEPKEARHNKKSIQSIQARAGSDLELPKDYFEKLGYDK